MRGMVRRYEPTKRYLNHGDTVYMVDRNNEIYTGKVLEVEHWYPFRLGTKMKRGGMVYYEISNSYSGHAIDLGFDFYRTKREAHYARFQLAVKNDFTYRRDYWRPRSAPMKYHPRRPYNSLRIWYYRPKKSCIHPYGSMRDHYPGCSSLWEVYRGDFE